jgi:hypothetical protein
MKYLMVSLTFCLLGGYSLAQDPGVRDSLIIETVYAELGDTVVDVRAYATCDDSVAFYNFPLTWNSINDSSVFPTAVTYQNTIARWDFHEDSLLFNEVLFRMVGWRDGGVEDPALITDNYREHCWTIRFSLDPSVGPQVVTIDTTFDDINGSLLFGLAGGIYSLIPVFTPGAIYYGFTSDIIGRNTNLPRKIYLLRNYPDPFNASTTIEFALPEAAEVQLSVYNLLGQKIEILFDGRKPAGEHSLTWDAGDLPSGVYFARLEMEGNSRNMKMVLLK